MNMYLRAGLGALALAAFAAPATAAVSIDTTACVSVSDEAGCRFTGNIAPNTVQETQDTYNDFMPAFPDAPITLNYLGQSDEGFGILTGDGTTSGSWETPGYLVDFLAVKAGNGFVLYKLAEAASSGSWNTLDLPANKAGNYPGLSHLTFFGSEGGVPGVPEPATWAMLIAGFGMVGASLRRRSKLSSVSA